LPVALLPGAVPGAEGGHTGTAGAQAAGTAQPRLGGRGGCVVNDGSGFLRSAGLEVEWRGDAIQLRELQGAAADRGREGPGPAADRAVKAVRSEDRYRRPSSLESPAARRRVSSAAAGYRHREHPRDGQRPSGEGAAGIEDRGQKCERVSADAEVRRAVAAGSGQSRGLVRHAPGKADRPAHTRRAGGARERGRARTAHIYLVRGNGQLAARQGRARAGGDVSASAAAGLVLWIVHASSPRKSEAPSNAAPPAAIGLTADQVRRKLDENKPALQDCVDDALRRDPSLKVGKIHVATTIAPSGQVTAARIDRQNVDESALGACLKRATQRIVFSQFSGAAFDVDIPISVSSGE